MIGRLQMEKDYWFKLYLFTVSLGDCSSLLKQLALKVTTLLNAVLYVLVPPFSLLLEELRKLCQ